MHCGYKKDASGVSRENHCDNDAERALQAYDQCIKHAFESYERLVNTYFWPHLQFLTRKVAMWETWV